MLESLESWALGLSGYHAPALLVLVLNWALGLPGTWAPELGICASGHFDSLAWAPMHLANRASGQLGILGHLG
jgi:hypothetical protein